MNDEKRMAGSYEIIHAIHLGDSEVVVGDNPAAAPEERFMCAFCEQNEIFALYHDPILSGDFAKVMEAFGQRVTEQAKKVQQELFQPSFQGIDPAPITRNDCTPINRSDDLNGKVVVIRPDVLRREYQTATRQLKLCTGGFGASPNSRGSACFCTDLYSGKKDRFERQDILGGMNEDQLPKWAKHHLEIRLDEMNRSKQKRKEVSL